MTGSYDDIIGLPHHVSSKHPQMPAAARAAQFAPFAALTGLGAAMDETGRLTVKRVELDEHELAALSEKLGLIRERIARRPEAKIEWFVPDKRKEGGSYKQLSVRIKRIDEVNRVILTEEGVVIAIDDIFAIELLPQG